MKIMNKQTGLEWEVVDRTLQRRLLSQDHYEKVKSVSKSLTKKPTQRQSEE